MADTTTKSESNSPKSTKERLDLLNQELNRELIFEGYPRLEVHKIIIDHIAGDETSFDRVWTCNALSLDDTLYERKDGERIPLGEPLRLLGPIRPPYCRDPIGIYFDPDEWDWTFSYSEAQLRYPKDDSVPICDEVVAENGSKARVFYQRLVRSVEADIEITFCCEDLGLQFQGEIFATTNGNPETKRVLVRLDDEDTSVKPDTPLPLDRSVVALPLKSVLHLSFDLTLKDYNLKIDLEDLDVLKFEVPDCSKEDSREVPVKVSDWLHPLEHNIISGILEDFKIKIKVSWSNDMCCYFDDKEIAVFDISSGSEDSEYSD